jgi:hypothetical protein
MSQYGITPTASTSPLNVATMARDSWFKGAIGKVAVYDHLLSQNQITAHYFAMRDAQPTGSCGDTCTLGHSLRRGEGRAALWVGRNSCSMRPPPALSGTGDGTALSRHCSGRLPLGRQSTRPHPCARRSQFAPDNGRALPRILGRRPRRVAMLRLARVRREGAAPPLRHGVSYLESRMGLGQPPS